MTVTLYDRKNSLPVRLAEFLTEHGYGISSPLGIARHHSQIGSNETKIGVLGQQRTKTILFGLLTWKHKRILHGFFTLPPKPFGVQQPSLIFKIYGRSHLEDMMGLANEVSSILGVDVELRLDNEQEQYEWFETEL